MSTSTKLIRNSTAEFLIFTGQAGEQSIEARYEQETVWLTQKLLAELFAVDVRTVSEHLKNIYESDELERAATLRKFRTVQTEGHREVARNIDFYNLDAIISVGYRVNSVRATQFRQWATGVLREFAIKGFVLDKKRLENGTFLNEDYFERLLAEIREIRISERKFYQKITDIYSMAVDYNRDAPTIRSSMRSKRFGFTRGWYFFRQKNNIKYIFNVKLIIKELFNEINAIKVNFYEPSFWRLQPLYEARRSGSRFRSKSVTAARATFVRYVLC